MINGFVRNCKEYLANPVGNGQRCLHFGIFGVMINKRKVGEAFAGNSGME